MSNLADDWDAINVPQSSAPKSLADEWDAISVKPGKPQVASVNKSGENQSNVPNAKNMTELLAKADAAPDKLKEGFKPLTDLINNQVSGIGANIIGGYNGLLTLLKGGSAEDATKAIENEVANRTYQPASKASQNAITVAASPVNPMNWPNMLTKHIGDSVYDVSGSPLLATGATTGLNALLMAAGMKGANRPISIKNSVNPSVMDAIQSDAGKTSSMANANSLTQAMSGQKAPTPNNLELATGQKPRYRANSDGSFTPIQGGAAPATEKPSASAQSSQPTTAPTFETPELPNAKSVLPPETQADNIATMKEIGLNEQRPSAITGDKFTAGQEYQHSKLDSPMGEVMRGQLVKEQSAIKNYASDIVQKTGASADAPEAVGQAIRSPLQDLSTHYDTQIGKLYDAADQSAAGAPVVKPNTLESLLKNPDFKETLLAQDKQGLLGAVERQLQRFQGLLPDDTGSIAPNTVKSAESFRQWLNKQWTPDNSQIVGQLKEALDTDVAKAGGEKVYQEARGLHAERKNTLDNPKGISSLLSEDGPGGINQKVPDEKVPSKLLSMPTKQFEHVINTYKTLPPELQPHGQQALAEIKGALAKKIYAAGDSGGTQNGPSVWNAANVTKELNAQRSKMAFVFTPEEIARFQTLNKAGHILQTPSAYPGAAVQGHNLLQRGMIMAPSAAGAAIGHSVAGVPGAFVGSGIGGAISSRIAKNADIANANKLQKAMSNPAVVKP